MHNELIEYPDPVIESYMERVRHLSPAARDHLDLHIMKHLTNGAWVFDPSVLIYGPLVAIGANTLIRRATRSSSVAAAIAYTRFFDDLRRQKWTLAGRGRVANGLVVLRCRALRPDAAFQAYADRMDAFVPHQSIGWTPPSAARSV